MIRCCYYTSRGFSQYKMGCEIPFVYIDCQTEGKASLIGNFSASKAKCPQILHSQVCILCIDGRAYGMLIRTKLDYLEIGNVAFEWAQSYDTKDWERLQQCLAPSIRLDFRSLRGALHEDLSPTEYAAILSDKKLLGDKRLKTQHLLGRGKWEVLSNGTVHIWHQIRVAHQRYTNEDLAVVENKGHAHGTTQHWYRKIEGTWKLEGVEPQLEFTEYDLFGTLNPKED